MRGGGVIHCCQRCGRYGTQYAHYLPVNGKHYKPLPIFACELIETAVLFFDFFCVVHFDFSKAVLRLMTLLYNPIGNFSRKNIFYDNILHGVYRVNIIVVESFVYYTAMSKNRRLL